MHEFSLACNILEIVEENVKIHEASKVSELTLEIGSLAGIELYALQSAIETLQVKTILEGARINYNIISATAVCQHCNLNFEPVDVFSPCPSCKNYRIQISSGKELIVKSIVIE